MCKSVRVLLLLLLLLSFLCAKSMCVCESCFFSLLFDTLQKQSQRQRDVCLMYWQKRKHNTHVKLM